MSPAQKSIDEEFGKEYADWVTKGGYSNTQKQLTQLSSVVNDLRAGKKYSGPLIGITPDVIGAVTNPEAIAARERVEEVVQRSLKEVLGGQFAQKEGEALIKRSFNPSLKPAENAHRVDLMINMIQSAAEQKNRAAEHFGKYGSLQGFDGKLPSFSDFKSNLESVWGDNNPSEIKPPAPGFVKDGFKFLGGDPSNRKSWVRAN